MWDTFLYDQIDVKAMCQDPRISQLGIGRLAVKAAFDNRSAEIPTEFRENRGKVASVLAGTPTIESTIGVYGSIVAQKTMNPEQYDPGSKLMTIRKLASFFLKQPAPTPAK